MSPTIRTANRRAVAANSTARPRIRPAGPSMARTVKEAAIDVGDDLVEAACNRVLDWYAFGNFAADADFALVAEFHQAINE